MINREAASEIGRSLDLDTYRERLGRIQDALTVIAGVAERLKADLLATDLRRTIQTLTDDLFKLVVVGHFSQGKSTVINALLGARLLPSSAHPTTAILNRLRHSDRAAIKLRYLDGSERGPLDVKAFQSVVAPPEPIPGDTASLLLFENRQTEIRRIAFAEVEYPWPLSVGGVEIIDTPGTNDLDPMRERITYDFIPNSDAAIFVLSARAITSESEVCFLKDRILKADIQRIFFVINFADVIARPDRARVVEFARTHLEPIVPDPRLFLVSARAALAHRLIAQGHPAKGAESMPFEECGFPELERALAEFLTNERGSIKLAKPREHGLRLAAELRQGPMVISRASLGVDVLEFTDRINRLEPEITRLKSERDQALQALDTSLANVGQTLVSELRRGLEDVADAAAALVASYTGPLDIQDLARYIENAIAPRQTALHEEIRRHQATVLQDNCSRTQRRLASAWENLYIQIDQILDPAPSVDGSTAVAKVDSTGDGFQPYYGETAAQEIPDFWGWVAIPITLIALPFFLILEALERERFLGRMRFEIERRYRNSIAETTRDFERLWKIRTEKILNNLATECNQNLRTLDDQLNCLRDDRRRQFGRAEDRRRELDEMESLLDHASRTLGGSGDIGRTP